MPSVALKIAVTAMSKLTKVIVDNGDGTYKIENQTPLKNTSWTFKLGQPFEAEMWDKKVQVGTRFHLLSVNNCTCGYLCTDNSHGRR